jgi:hypothetical protein
MKIVHPAAAAAHGDGDVGFFERAGEVGGRELRAPVGVEYLRPAERREGLFKRRPTTQGALSTPSR